MKKRMVIRLVILGVLMMGTVSQVLAEDKKAEGITSGASMSNQNEKSFFSKENLILLAQVSGSSCDGLDFLSCYTLWVQNRTCCWVNMNGQGVGHCARCQ